MARHVDKFCFIRGLHTDTPAHPAGRHPAAHRHGASRTLTRPSMGAWLLYGLGTENQDLPGYITINPPPNFGGAVNYGSAFLPAHFQGTRINDTGVHARTCEAQTARVAAAPAARPDPGDEPRPGRQPPALPTQLDGVIQSFELAFRMQGKVPELLDISREPQAVLDAYGVKPGPAGSFARQCLMARRLSEAGVRFVEICQSGWDHHTNLHQGLITQSPHDRSAHGRAADRPRAAGPARRYARPLRQRVRPPADGAGRRRPRPQHHRLPDVAGRRRREGGLLVRQRPTNTASTRSKAACTRPTCTPRCWP